jgi:hypothetical protein
MPCRRLAHPALSPPMTHQRPRRKVLLMKFHLSKGMTKDPHSINDWEGINDLSTMTRNQKHYSSHLCPK